ncbi:T9SS type A sorting domain-containing protein [Pinibacter soli]|uniref:T9SS type A sorting domain-containing protein n=1 Tax=Pinibacter soli TaxID=3044211 RepID=A0ABT6RDL1_9BACT|nr:T9SS type A sorting domain-containing protein [Pinibacter soli]MDI3320608.1 T9SS type A sorting domain-containing protein [Pinibacter soli]
MKTYLPVKLPVRKILVAIFLLFISICKAQTPQSYTAIDGTLYNLYKWEGNKVMLLSSSSTLDQTTMTNWLQKMDETYNYYALCTGKEPSFWPPTYINNKSTIAQVPSTCGAGCGYLGFTGIEMQTTYFNNTYNFILGNNQYDQEVFYEFGRNFWFYSPQLAYKSNDPIVTGYAVFMRFMSMEYIGVNGAPFNGSLPFTDFQTQIKALLNTYLNNTSLNWNNTLGVGQGVPNNWGATDLFASFCFYLKENYGGQNWVQNVWRYAGLRPDAATTQDAVDNFIVASSQAANSNLSDLFTSWRWPVSTKAVSELNAIFNPLPVKIVSFTGKSLQCNYNVLEWKTADESNNKGCEVQRSKDRTSFEKVGFVFAKNNNANIQQYNFEDKVGVSGNYFYRLKQIDIDGNYVYSVTIKIESACEGATVINVYPNPVKQLLHIDGIRTNSNTIKLVGSLGNTLAVWRNKNEASIDLSRYPSGIYFLIINENTVFRVLKE